MVWQPYVQHLGIYGQLGLLKDVNATSYLGFEDKMDCKNYGGRVVTAQEF